jgi:RNA polymerase sigma-70 factor (ECF subfamily)
VPWLQPYPDVLLDTAAGPEEAAIRRETVELAYLAVIQLLPARQRAVLLLRDIQGYSAAETAGLLGLTVAAVTSALQRARATIAGRVAARDADWSPDGITEADRALLAAFIDAHERQDPVASLAVIREDIRVSMPPNPGLFTGREVVAGLMAQAYDRAVFGDWRLLATAANRMPAAASYLRRAGSGVYLPFKLDVLRTGGGLIAEITTFDASQFDRFGLPVALPGLLGPWLLGPWLLGPWLLGPWLLGPWLLGLPPVEVPEEGYLGAVVQGLAVDVQHEGGHRGVGPGALGLAARAGEGGGVELPDAVGPRVVDVVEPDEGGGRVTGVLVGLEVDRRGAEVRGGPAAEDADDEVAQPPRDGGGRGRVG